MIHKLIHHYNEKLNLITHPVKIIIILPWSSLMPYLGSCMRSTGSCFYPDARSPPAPMQQPGDPSQRLSPRALPAQTTASTYSAECSVQNAASGACAAEEHPGTEFHVAGAAEPTSRPWASVCASCAPHTSPPLWASASPRGRSRILTANV